MTSSLTSAQQQELKGAFDVFDTDESGKISSQELGKIFRALNVKVDDNQLKNIVNEMDLDGSGQIEFGEFCRVMAKTFFRKYSEDELHTAFRQFDQDGSGYIQASELESIMEKMGRRFNKEEIEGLVNTLDKSGDGKIGFDEFVLLFQ